MICKGVLQDGSGPGTYDDRKLRCCGIVQEPNDATGVKTLTLSVGPSCFPDCQNDIQRDRLTALQLMRVGVEAHADPYAYFERGIGIVVIPLTVEGCTFIGKRIHTQEYNGLLSFVAGWASFSSDVQGIDFRRDANNELREEISISTTISSDHFQLVGVAGHALTGETDLVFVVQTELGNDHFRANNWPEHRTWQAITNANDAKEVLIQGIEDDNNSEAIAFSSRFALEYLLNHHWSK